MNQSFQKFRNRLFSNYSQTHIVHVFRWKLNWWKQNIIMDTWTVGYGCWWFVLCEGGCQATRHPSFSRQASACILTRSERLASRRPPHLIYGRQATVMSSAAAAAATTIRLSHKLLYRRFGTHIISTMIYCINFLIKISFRKIWMFYVIGQ